MDQKYAKKYARGLLRDYYQEEIAESKFKPTDYQLSSGGIALLPYSSEELELSARVAALGIEGFDKKSLAQYFFRRLEDKKSSRKEVSLALFGLAELEEPVLMRIYCR